MVFFFYIRAIVIVVVRCVPVHDVGELLERALHAVGEVVRRRRGGGQRARLGLQARRGSAQAHAQRRRTAPRARRARARRAQPRQPLRRLQPPQRAAPARSRTRTRPAAPPTHLHTLYTMTTSANRRDWLNNKCHKLQNTSNIFNV